MAGAEVTVVVDYSALVVAREAEFKPLAQAEKKQGNEFLLTVSGVQWDQARMLASWPVEGLAESFTYLSQHVPMAKATLTLRRRVGQIYPEHDPRISFTAYAELVKVTETVKTDDPVRDRKAILAKFTGTPENPIAPEEWTVDNMKSVIRGYYQATSSELGEEVLEKTVEAKGIGRVKVKWSRAGIEFIIPKTTESGEVIEGLDYTTFRAKFPKSKAKSDVAA
jgi:hypothetical protein